MWRALLPGPALSASPAGHHPPRSGKGSCSSPRCGHFTRATSKTSTRKAPRCAATGPSACRRST
eukprot:759116-Prorocentrum_lima.AAC.1